MLVLKVGFPQGSSVTCEQKCRFSGSRRAVFITPHVQGMPMLGGGGETPKSNLLSRGGNLSGHSSHEGASREGPASWGGG